MGFPHRKCDTCEAAVSWMSPSGGRKGSWVHDAPAPDTTVLVENDEGQIIHEMTGYTFAVTVEAHTAAQAAQVMGERIDHEEDYGFPYTIERTILPMMVDGEPYD